MNALFSCLLLGALLGLARPAAAGLPDTVAMVKPAVVAIGSHLPTRSPAIAYSGTGWVTGDGLSVITSAHVWPQAPDLARQESWGIVVEERGVVRFRPATLAARDSEHDLVHLRLDGAPLPALTLGDSGALREGQDLAFTGFPLGMVLGMRPATHRATLAAITPLVAPAVSPRQLDARAVQQLQKAPVTVLQLDGTAYPGNSGSPLYDPDTGAVLGVISMVYVQGLKENAISHPSGISYAIPSSYVRALLQQRSR